MPGAPIPSYTVGSIRRFLDSFDLACTLRRQPAGRGYCPPRQRLPSHCPPPPPTTVYPVSAWPYLHVACPPSLARGARNVCLVGDKPNVPRIGVEGMQGSMVTRLRLCIERAPSPPPPRARPLRIHPIFTLPYLVPFTFVVNESIECCARTVLYRSHPGQEPCQTDLL